MRISVSDHIQWACTVVVLAACFVGGWLVTSAEAGCDDPIAKRVAESLAEAERYSQTAGTYSKHAGNIEDTRRLLAGNNCIQLALFYAEYTVARVYLESNDGRAADHLAAACKFSEQVRDDDRWDREFVCKSALMLALLASERFDDAKRLTASLRKLATEHQQDTNALVGSLLGGLTDASVNDRPAAAHAYAEAIDTLASGSFFDLDKAVYAAERHLFLGEYGAALAKATEAHRRLEADHLSKQDAIALQVLRVRALVHLALNEPEKALDALREGETLVGGIRDQAKDDRVLFNTTGWEVAKFYAALTKVHLVLDNKREARVALDAAQAALTAIGLPEGVLQLSRMAAQLDPAKASTIMRGSADLIGQWLLDLRSGAADVQLMNELIDHARLDALASREDRIWLYAALGRALAASDEGMAIRRYVAAIDLIEDGRIQTTAAAEALPSFFSQYVDIYGGLIAVLSRQSGKAQNVAIPSELTRFGASYPEIALYFAEAAHARVFAERYGPRMIQSFGARANVPAAKLERLRDLRALIAQTSDATFTTRIAEDLLVMRERSERATNAYVQFLESLKVQYPDFAKLAFPRPIALGRLPRRLDGQFIIAYKITEDAVYWWLIRNRAIVAFERSAIGRSQLVTAVGRFLDAIDDEAAHDGLREALVRGPFTKIESMSPAGATLRVVIVPDEVLYLMPWEALPGLHGARLGEQFIISYAPSLTVLAQAAEEGSTVAARKMALVLGNTLDANIKIEGFPLKFPKLGQEEAEKVNSLLKRSGYQSVLAAGPPGPKATRGRLFDGGSARYEIIHIDTHGFAGTREPPPSIILRPDTQSAYPYDLVTLADLGRLNLKARLVTLSACQTALGSGTNPLAKREDQLRRLSHGGNALPGEGVLSLARLFMLGGSRTVLASLDLVQPQVALALWEKLYEELGSGRAPDVATALFRAKAALRARPEGQLASQWSTFILIGDPSR